MKRVDMYQTADGVLHATERGARRHADERYGKAVTDLAHEMTYLVQYRDMIDFIERNLDQFASLKELKKDMELEAES